jgi:hypothetical protein
MSEAARDEMNAPTIDYAIIFPKKIPPVMEEDNL